MGEMALGGRRVPVVTGTMDAWSGLLGAGVRRAPQGVYMSGTSEIVAIASAERIGAPGVVTFPKVAGLTINAGPTQSGGDALQWWAEAAGLDVGAALALAGQADRDGRPILFLPHLEGERAPLWDAELRGAFLGLDRRAGAADFAWRCWKASRCQPACCSTPATKRRAAARRGCFTPAEVRGPISGRRSALTSSACRWTASPASMSAASARP